MISSLWLINSDVMWINWHLLSSQYKTLPRRQGKAQLTTQKLLIIGDWVHIWQLSPTIKILKCTVWRKDSSFYYQSWPFNFRPQTQLSMPSPSLPSNELSWPFCSSVSMWGVRKAAWTGPRKSILNQPWLPKLYVFIWVQGYVCWIRASKRHFLDDFFFTLDTG